MIVYENAEVNIAGVVVNRMRQPRRPSPKTMRFWGIIVPQRQGE